MINTMSKCNGVIYYEGRQTCPQRETCVRYLTRPTDNKRDYSWVFVVGYDQIYNCNQYIPTEK